MSRDIFPNLNQFRCTCIKLEKIFPELEYAKRTEAFYITNLRHKLQERNIKVLE